MGFVIEIGSFIKLQRTKREMTLKDLAEGIVSVSYLSKIENLKTQASYDIIQLLCNRLGIQLDHLDETTIKEKCEQWYSMLYDSIDKQEIRGKYEELQDIMDRNLSESLIMFEIHKIRYYLLIGEFDKSLKKINELSEISKNFSEEETYYWLKFRGNFYYTKDAEYNKALHLYKIAEEKLKKMEVSEKEKADLFYIISVTHSKLRNTLESIDYAEQSLNIYMKLYDFRRCAQCHIVLGISYRRIKMYDRAIKNYNLAKHLGDLNKDNQVIQLTNLNLGYLYSTKGDKDAAIQYYLEVVHDKGIHLEAKLTAIAALVKEYYSTLDKEKTKTMIQKGFELLEENQITNKSEAFKNYYYIFTTYQYAVENQHDRFEAIVVHEFIPLLKKQKDYANLVVYAGMLAEHYEGLGKYKKAAKYYKLANSTYEELINI